MELRKATINDIDRLIKLRLDYLRDDKGYLSVEEENLISTQLHSYFPEHIDHDFTAILAEEDGKVVSTAYLVISEKPANTTFINGVTGTLLNVFTYAEYRRKGYASKVISKVMEEAKQADVSVVDLSATESGKRLYEKYGFVESKHTTYMRLKLKGDNK